MAIATRVRAVPREGDIVNFLPSRAELVALDRLDVVGLYIPSRDESHEKIQRKRGFCTAVSGFADRPLRDAVVIGDLNVLEPVHRPHYGTFRDWEYRFYDEFLVRGFVDAYRLRHPSDMEYSWVDYANRGYHRSCLRQRISCQPSAAVRLRSRFPRERPLGSLGACPRTRLASAAR